MESRAAHSTPPLDVYEGANLPFVLRNRNLFSHLAHALFLCQIRNGINDSRVLSQQVPNAGEKDHPIKCLLCKFDRTVPPQSRNSKRSLPIMCFQQNGGSLVLQFVSAGNLGAGKPVIVQEESADRTDRIDTRPKHSYRRRRAPLRERAFLEFAN